MAYERQRKPTAEFLAAFYLNPNGPGRSAHIANAGFIVAPEWRNRGLGRLLGAVMLDHAQDLGYPSVIFNLVFVQNRIARNLWDKFGLHRVGVIHRAVRNDDGSYQYALIMYRSFI